jgi:hypothetical protein
MSYASPTVAEGYFRYTPSWDPWTFVAMVRADTRTPLPPNITGVTIRGHGYFIPGSGPATTGTIAFGVYDGSTQVGNTAGSLVDPATDEIFSSINAAGRDFVIALEDDDWLAESGLVLSCSVPVLGDTFASATYFTTSGHVAIDSLQLWVKRAIGPEVPGQWSMGT